MTTLHRLFAQGQSVWIDFIRRSFLVSGGLQDWLIRAPAALPATDDFS